MTDPKEGSIVIIGSGLIGRSWAMVFASGGFKVRLYDIVKEQVTAALEDIRKQMEELRQSGMLRGSLSSKEQISLISGCSDLKLALEGAIFIQLLGSEPCWGQGLFAMANAMYVAGGHAEVVDAALIFGKKDLKDFYTGSLIIILSI